MDPSDPVYAAAVIAAEAEADAAQREFESPKARERREQSQDRFADLSGGEAVALVREAFPEIMTGPTEVSELALPPGAEISEFTSPFTAQVVTPDGKPAGLLESSAPLTTDAGADTGIDLSLERQGDEFVAESPRVDVELPVDATDPAVLADGKIAVEPAGADASTAVPRGDRLIYPSIDTDTDYVLQPVEQGVESLWQLRSVDSPETLRLDYLLPAGAQLELLRAPGSGDAVAIIKDGRTIGSVRPVSAMDAAGRPVPAEMTVDGDSLVVSVDHRSDAVQYPVLVDPVTESWTTQEFTSCGANSAGGGWNSPVIEGARPFWSVCNYSGYGLWLGSYSGTDYLKYDAANWSYYARPNTYISDVTWGGWSHSNVWRTDAYVGLSSRYPTPAWQVLQFDTLGRAAQDFSQHQDPRVQNYAVLGLRFHEWGRSQGGNTGVRWVAMYIRDGGPPTINAVHHENGVSTATSDEIWDMPWSSSPKLRVRATDVGLGINSVSVVGQNGRYLWGPHWYTAGGSIGASSNVCRGTRASPCPQSVDSGMLTANTGNLSVGDNVGWVVVQDASGEQTWGQKLHMRYDATAPGLQIAGALWDDRGGVLPPNGYWLAIESDDAVSGTVRLSVRVDGVTMLGVNQPCPSGGCSLDSEDFEWVAPAGNHVILVEATDQAGNVTTRQWNVSLSGARPTTQTSTEYAPAAAGVGGGCPVATAQAAAPFDGEAPDTIRNGYWRTGSGATAGETTWFYDGANYRVFRCDVNGALVVSQYVEPLLVPDGSVTPLVTAVTVPSSAIGEYESTYREYPAPTDPEFAAAWGTSGGTGQTAARRDATSEVIPPTQ